MTEGQPRFQVPELSDKLYVVPKQPPVELLARYEGVQKKKAPNVKTNTQVSDAARDETIFQASISGKVANGLPDAVGFVTCETTTQKMGKEFFEEDTLDAFNRTRQEALDAARRRKHIATQPFATEEPDVWTTTSHHAHIDYSGSVDPADMTATSVHGKPRGRGVVDNPELTRKVAPRDFAAEAQAREVAMRDTDTLRQKLEATRGEGVEVARNGTSVWVAGQQRASDRPRAGWVGGKPSTTNGDTYQTFNAADPEALKEESLTMAEAEYIARMRRRKAERGTGDWGTTTQEQYTDKTAQAEVCTEYRKSHVFDKKAGTAMMPRKHDPDLKVTNQQYVATNGDVVPDHFMSTSQANNAHFRRFD